MALNPTLIRRIVYPSSRWVFSFMLTCDNTLAIQFWRRLRDIHLPGHKKGVSPGRIPGVCCLYPATTQAWFNLMLAWPSKGKFVHEFLDKKLAYTIISPPGAPFGCKETLIATSSVNPSAVGQPVTFTGVYTNTSGRATPEGTITWYDGAAILGLGTMTTSANKMTSVFTTSSLTAGTHVISAVFADLTTGNEGFDPGTGSVTQVVGTTVACCPGAVPNTLYLTLTGVSAFATSYMLTYNGIYWTTGPFSVGGSSNCEFRLECLGANVFAFRLSQWCGGSMILGANPGIGSSCSPFSLLCGPLGLKYGAACTSNDTAFTSTVTS
jgi:hypothetical protein